MKKILPLLTAAALLTAWSLPASAQGASDSTPGHKMQDKGPKGDHPGASGYSPGHQMQDKGPKGDNPGASGYAPGHNK
jgi:hypothetical protein